ncbi:LacI family DNA-binding transcriptional regulator [Marinomonas sp. RSW2]|uniref:LacI family DNA-binding transcriptional regulator n=1 Tax=Marinomonas maritima TaxID=2940935 RepID=A0ABT5WAD7_9GAMM|nr:LacI family DNA-binding transcriptional regulator [Marinomonas maritima]MDE8601781.1 LacI family DNA-binding transcriptional regulator [Marinomonas maritima]
MQNKSKGFATISDVAKYAKVGKTSVSRYLNGEQDKLSDPLREKIFQAIEHLHFRPNHSARMLKAGHSKLIGLLLADVTNPYSIDVLQGIEHVCRREGYMLMVCNTDNQKELQDSYLTLLEAHRVDGIIVNTAGMAQKQITNLKRISCPLVLVDRIDTSLGFDTVGLDNEAAVKEVCTHLQTKAYQSILVVTESIAIDPRQARVDAIKAFTRENNDISCEIIEIEKMSVDLLIKVIQDFIVSHPNRKKAIFTTNGVAMMSTAKALKQLDIHIGSQIGLISIDDPEWAQLFEGGITVMRQPTRVIGQTACERLLARVQDNNEPAQHIKLKAELVIRQST